MDIRKIKKLIELVEESGIMELEISEGKNPFVLIVVQLHQVRCNIAYLYKLRQHQLQPLLHQPYRRQLRQSMQKKCLVTLFVHQW